MNKYLLITLALSFLLFSNNTFSQKGLLSQRYSQVQIEADKKSSYYSKQMKKTHKNGYPIWALSYAFILKKNGKKKYIKKANKFLTSHYEENITSAIKVLENLAEETKNYKSEQTALDAKKLVLVYQNMVYLNDLIEKDDGQYKKFEDYSDRIEDAEVTRVDYFEKTAQLIFEEVKTARSNVGTKNEYKTLVKKLEHALNYDRRNDISNLRDELFPLAVTSLGIGKAYDQISTSNVLENSIREKIYETILDGTKINRKKRKPMPVLRFFKLFPNDIAMTSTGSDFLVEVTAKEVSVDYINDPDHSEAVSQSEGNGDNKKTYSANFITHGKRARVVMEGSYIIKERKTGKVIRNNTVTGNYAWMDNWYSYSGNIKGLSKREKRMIKLKESKYPSKTELTQSVTNYDNGCFAQRVGFKVLEYIQEVGQ